MINEDALYHDTVLVSAYDVLNRDRPDHDFYRSRLPAQPVRVVDIGCGTGTLAIGLARLGHSVDALDPSPEMIDFARRKPGAGHVNWIVGTHDAIGSTQEYDVAVMTGHAFQCLLEDSEITGFFETVGEHLATDGILLFETRNPEARAWDRWRPEHAAPPVPLPSGGTVRLTHEVLDDAGGIVTFRETYRFEPGMERTSISRLRFADPDGILQLARAAGLRCAGLWGDWDSSGFDRSKSPEIIFRLTRV